MFKELQESTADGDHILGIVEVAGVVKRYNEEAKVVVSKASLLQKAGSSFS